MQQIARHQAPAAASRLRAPLGGTRPARRHQQLHKPHRLRLQPAASASTEPALTALRAARQQACRQGCMFVAPPHLLLGLLDVPGCEASAMLTQAGLSPEAAEAALVDPLLLSTSRSLSGGDLHWAPDAQAALETAAAAAEQQGLAATGTPHLLLGVVRCGNAAVNKLLQKCGIQPDAFASLVEEAASSCQEAAAPAPAQPMSGAAAAAALVQQYRQHVAQHGTAPPQLSAAAAGAAGLDGGATNSSTGAATGAASGGGTRQFDPNVLARTPEDDDIYE